MSIKTIVKMIAFLSLMSGAIIVAISDETKGFSSFDSWQAACDQLPKYNKKIENLYQTPLDTTCFEQEIDRFLVTMEKQHDKLFWLNNVKPCNACDTFQVYVEKLIIPTGATVAIHGDLHGDVHSMIRFIETCAEREVFNSNDLFKIKDKNFYLLFLGDYVDRGWYGAEVMYTILRLKNENPDNVFMVRGNHEDLNLNGRYGFTQELSKKFSCPNLASKINRLYNTLPLAFYLGAGKKNAYNIIQCCHGGIEIGFDPKPLLENAHLSAGMVLSHVEQETAFKKVCNCDDLRLLENYFKDKPISRLNGFMWNDFIVDPGTNLALSPRDGYRGTILTYGELLTKRLLKIWSGKSYQLRSIFRAHQHGDSKMRDRILNIDKLSHPSDTGVGKLWVRDCGPGLLDDVAAITFSVAPDAGYGWPMHSFALLDVADKYEDWRLWVIQKTVEEVGFSG